MSGLNIRPEVFPAFMELARQAGEEQTPCHQDPELWYSYHRADQEEAVARCKTCPLMWECLAFALDNRETEGIWGGQTAEERAVHLRHRRTALRLAQKHAAKARREAEAAAALGQQELFPVMA